MKKLLRDLRKLKKSSVKKSVDKRLREFESFQTKPVKSVFKEMCFCILTANFTAERAIAIQSEVGDGFLKLPEKKLAKKLKKLGHRYPHTRAKYIVEARQHVKSLKQTLKSIDCLELRDWFSENVKGLGYKEASHFLRNIGFKNYAIIDFHIVDVLVEYSIIQKPKTMSRKKYLEIEGLLQTIAGKLNMSLAELDLYLWYVETGKILK